MRRNQVEESVNVWWLSHMTSVRAEKMLDFRIRTVALFDADSVGVCVCVLGFLIVTYVRLKR